MIRPRRPPARQRIDLIGPSVQVIFYAVIVSSVYLLVAGHNQPGGGFVGGLVAGAGLTVYYVAGGIEAVRALTRLRPWTILGGGLALAVTTAVLPLLTGAPVLEASSWELDLPVFEKVKLPTVLAFDTGVYLVVVGLVLMVFEAFGDEYGEAREAPTAGGDRT